MVEDLQRFLAIVGGQHLVAVPGQRPLGDGADHRLVLDQQHGPGAPSSLSCGLAARRPALLRLDLVPRQVGGEAPPPPERQSITARLLDDAVDRGQAKPGALADLLGGEERLEDLAEDFGGMPLPVSAIDSAVVGNRQISRPSPPPGRPGPIGLDGQSPAAFDTMASRALTARLTITCSSWPGSARTGEVAAVLDHQLPFRRADVSRSRCETSADVVEVQDLRAAASCWREKPAAGGSGRRLVGGST